MEDEERLFEALRSLAANRPFTRADVAKLTGTTLVRVPDESTEYFDVERSSRGTTLFDAVELRTPRASGRDGLVVLDLAGGRCVTRDDVAGRYGREYEPVPASPHAPPDAPHAIRYRMSWGVATFAFQRTGRECLESVVLDATEA